MVPLQFCNDADIKADVVFNEQRQSSCIIQDLHGGWDRGRIRGHATTHLVDGSIEETKNLPAPKSKANSGRAAVKIKSILQYLFVIISSPRNKPSAQLSTEVDTSMIRVGHRLTPTPIQELRKF